MSKKIITCAITMAMFFGIFSFPAAGHGAELEEQAVQDTEKTAVEAAKVAEAKASVEAEKEKKAETPVTVAKVTGVKAKTADSDEVQLTWGKVNGASGYEVYKYSTKENKYKKIAETKSSSFKSSNLKADTTYRYKVKAYVSKDGKKRSGNFSDTVKGKTDKTDGQKIVLKAKKKVGAKYRAGAKGPDAFDCSGFVYWVYKNAGVDPKKAVVRTSSAGLYLALRKYTVSTSVQGAKKAKAGDIVLFKKGGRYSHAAIYCGKGKIIHASNPRRGVVIQSLKQLHRSGTRVAAVIRVVED